MDVDPLDGFGMLRLLHALDRVRVIPNKEQDMIVSVKYADGEVAVMGYDPQHAAGLYAYYSEMLVNGTIDSFTMLGASEGSAADWAEQVERLIQQRKLSPGARDMSFGDIFHQYKEANALTVAEALEELLAL
jgi:hypothetical protein